MSKLPTPSETFDEDLGYALNRATPPHAPKEISVAPITAPSANVTLQPATEEEEHLDIATFFLSSELEFSQSRREPSAVSSVVLASIPTVTLVPTAAKRKKDNSEGGPTKTAKRKKKRDEIDDIFGS
ncbi:hypothetical protein GSI_13671 [Ganoderma sinense ZZ0214-1]|uniref:Uncharacterized protein n=1 Tax=Ganoderma sinense ZZ0214-1 TaxID=1077348 RepID=A0A2G8RQY1_9APHY|nr:hypothetical protein GSI_13671 [Ganoderma sinense ZZ0214-1]